MQPENKGVVTPTKILDQLNFASYCTQRDLGKTHKQLAAIIPGWDIEEYDVRYQKMKTK